MKDMDENRMEVKVVQNVWLILNMRDGEEEEEEE